MTHTTIIDRVRNYNGENPFVLKIKESLKKWGSLNGKQLEAVEKALNSKSNVVSPDSLTPEMKTIFDYQGPSEFVLDIKKKLQTYGTLTHKQVEAANRQIQKDQNKEKTIQVKWPTPGETIKIGRTVGQRLKEQYGLKFNPILLDITKILAISPKAIKFSGKMTVKRGDVCMCCAKTLTDEFSMATHMGKICAKHMGVEYIKDVSEVEKFRNEYLKRVEEIGEMEFWVPKAKIEKWEGKMRRVLQAI